MSSGSGPPTGICVLGFHRSGTSLTARVLQLLGVDLGPDEDLLPAVEGDNPAGYWEPRWMNDLNDEVLAALGCDMWHPLWVEDDWTKRPELEPLRRRAAELLRQKFDGRPVWGFKDPRTSLTLPFWRDLVPDLRFVICLRSPADAVASSLRRTNPDLNSRWAWGQLWLEYTGRSLAETEGAERILVNYEDFFTDPQGEVSRLAAFVGIGGSSQSEVADAVRADLQHHRSSPAEVAADSGLPVEARAAYVTLRAARAAEDRDDALRRGLERAARELWSAHRAWVVERGDLQRRAGQAQDLETSLADALADVERVRADGDNARRRAERAERELEVYRSSRAARLAAAFGRRRWRS